MKQYYAAAAVALLLGACSHFQAGRHDSAWRAQQDETAAFYAQGRLAVKEGDKGSYANFEWQDGPHVQQIAVNTPLGNTVGLLCRDDAGVVAEDAKGHQYRAASVAELSRRLLGFSLPLQHLNHWVRGQWAAQEPHQLLPDGRLRQSGWLIRRQVGADGQTPRLLVLESERFNIRLVFDQFEPLAAGHSLRSCAFRQPGGAQTASLLEP